MDLSFKKLALMFWSFARLLLFCKLKNYAVLTFCCALILLSFALKIYPNLVDCLVDNMSWFGRRIRLISSQFACDFAAISSFFVGFLRTFLPVLVRFRKRFLGDTFEFFISFHILSFGLIIWEIGWDFVLYTANSAILLLL